jgi:hypothetical protein
MKFGHWKRVRRNMRMSWLTTIATLPAQSLRFATLVSVMTGRAGGLIRVEALSENLEPLLGRGRRRAEMVSVYRRRAMGKFAHHGHRAPQDRPQHSMVAVMAMAERYEQKYRLEHLPNPERR